MIGSGGIEARKSDPAKPKPCNGTTLPICLRLSLTYVLRFPVTPEA